MKKVEWIFFGASALFFLLLILGFPLNKHEWMLNEPDLEMTRSALPIDAEASMYPFFAGFPALLLWAFYFFSKTRKEKMIVLSVIGILFVVWVIKFRSIFFGA